MIPGFIERERMLDTDVERGYRPAGPAREDDRAWFGHVAWPPRAVDGKRDVAARFEILRHGGEALDPAARRTPLRGAEPEALDHTAGPLAVEIHGIKYHDAAVAPDPRGRKDTAVPESPDSCLTAVSNLDRVVHADNFNTQSGPEQAYEPINDRCDHRNLHPPPAGEVRHGNFGRLASSGGSAGGGAVHGGVV